MKENKLTILFDAGPLVNGQKSGVGYFTYRLVSALAAADPHTELIGHYFNFLGRKRPDLPNYPNLKYKSSKIIPGKVLSVSRRFGFQLPFDLLIRARGDVALFPNFVSLPLLQGAKKVVFIHDLCFEDQPEYLQPANQKFLKRFVPPSVRKADLIVAISEATKRAIVRHYGVNPAKVVVISIAPPVPETKQAPKPSIPGLPDKFILFVGTLEPRKNFISLARAYAALPKELKKTFGLVLAGGRGWGSDAELAEIEQLQKTGENILLTGYIDDAAKIYLYQNASLFVLPSHYEGFGMPILEAMSYGLPVAISDIPVFHEVAGDAAIYFEAENIASLAGALSSGLTNKPLRNRLIQAGGAQVSKFSWEENADRLLKIMEALR